MAKQLPAGTVKTDGRKRRWHQHKVERRNELIDGTIEAIRRRGRFVNALGDHFRPAGSEPPIDAKVKFDEQI